MPRSIRAGLTTLAHRLGLTISATGTAMIERGLQEDITRQHASFLIPMVKEAISSRNANLAKLLVEIYLMVLQTQQLIVQILARQGDSITMTDTRLNRIRIRAGEEAKRVLRSRRPSLDEDTMRDVITWLSSAIESKDPPARDGNTGREASSLWNR